MPQLVMTAVTHLPQVQIDSDPKTWAAEAEKLAAGKGIAAGSGPSKVRRLASRQRLPGHQALALSAQSSSGMLGRPDRVTHWRPATAQQASGLHPTTSCMTRAGPCTCPLEGPPSAALHTPRHAWAGAPMHLCGREPGAGPAPGPVELPVHSLMSGHCVVGIQHRTAQQQAALSCGC